MNEAGPVTLTDCTLADNSAAEGGGGLDNVSRFPTSTATLNNTIVAGSTSGGDIAGTVSGSNNLIDDAASAARRTKPTATRKMQADTPVPRAGMNSCVPRAHTAIPPIKHAPPVLTSPQPGIKRQGRVTFPSL